MNFTEKKNKKFKKSDYESYLLAGDIGGTNTNLGIFGIKKNIPYLLLSFHFKSRKLKSLYSAIKEAMHHAKKNYGISITKCCLGIAGAVSFDRNYVHLTNAGLDFNRKLALKKLNLKKIYLMNDFEAVGYGINLLGKGDIFAVKKGEKTEKAPMLAIGAGTGFGKTLLVYDNTYGSYKPLPSEVDHSDFAVQSRLDFEMINFIKKYRKINQNVSNGSILSGKGIINIYLFLRNSKRFKETGYTKEIDNSEHKPELISKYKSVDKTCKETFNIFAAAYARLAKNLALDTLPLGGIYISGGIAPKNKSIFNKKFVNIFEDSRTMKNILKKIPIYLVLTPNIGLLGAGFAGAELLK